MSNVISTTHSDLSDAPVGASVPHQANVAADRTRAWIRREVNGWRWSVRADFARLFDGEDAPDWPNVRDDARAERVKVNDEREVWRVEVNGEVLFAKVARPSRGWNRWRRVLLGSDAAREQRVAEYAARHCIGAVTAVGAGAGPVGGRSCSSILVTIGRTSARPLSEFWTGLDANDPATRTIKNRVVEAVARLIASAHQNGFVHPDLHAGNVLVEPSGGGEYRALFVDLHNVRTGRRLGDRAVTRNLAQFSQWFRVRGLLSDRIRFLDRYLHWRDAVAGSAAHAHHLSLDRRGLIRALDHAARVHAETLYAKRDRRAMRSGRYFARLTLGDGWRAHVLLECKHPVPGSRGSRLVFTTDQWRRWLARPLDLIHTADRRSVIKESASAVTCRGKLPLDGAEPLTVVCKRASPTSTTDRVKSLLRPSRAMLAWQRGNALLHRRIPTGLPLGVVERRRFGVVCDSIIITECIEHGQDLDTLLTVGMRQMPAARQRWLKDRVIESLAGVLRRLHDLGFTHRDLKAPNIIVQWDRQGDEPPRVVLVDMDGLRRTRGDSGDAWIRAVTRLNVSLDHCKRATLTDRLRFLERYLTRIGPPAGQIKPLWRGIAAQSDRKREQRAHHQAEMLAKYGRF